MDESEGGGADHREGMQLEKLKALRPVKWDPIPLTQHRHHILAPVYDHAASLAGGHAPHGSLDCHPH